MRVESESEFVKSGRDVICSVHASSDYSLRLRNEINLSASLLAGYPLSF